MKTPTNLGTAADVGLPSGACSAPLVSECHAINVICPHCGASYQAEAEDYSEEVRDEECFACKRIYQVWQEFSVTHHTCAKR